MQLILYQKTKIVYAIWKFECYSKNLHVYIGNTHANIKMMSLNWITKFSLEGTTQSNEVFYNWQ